MIHFHRYSELTSTNTELTRLADAGAPDGTVVTARSQTAGRGQRGNTWESEPGKNVTMSILLHPEEIAPREQFSISEAVALAVAETLDNYLSPELQAQVKWPNDIYVGNRKICGILIENRITVQSIDRSIAGIGLNVNQQQFTSDAPNPVSIFQLTSQVNDIEEIEESIANRVMANIKQLSKTALHIRYMQRLWRRHGFHPYAEPNGEAFMARIYDVALTGHLTLERHNGARATYAFKEVAALLCSDTAQ